MVVTSRLFSGDFVTPTVLTTDGTIDANLSVGILSSKKILEDVSKTNPGATNADGLFTFLKANAFQNQNTPRAALSETALDSLVIGYITNSTIVRIGISAINGKGGAEVNPDLSLRFGSVGMSLDASGSPAVYNIFPS